EQRIRRVRNRLQRWPEEVSECFDVAHVRRDREAGTDEQLRAAERGIHLDAQRTCVTVEQLFEQPHAGRTPKPLHIEHDAMRSDTLARESCFDRLEPLE